MSRATAGGGGSRGGAGGRGGGGGGEGKLGGGRGGGGERGPPRRPGDGHLGKEIRHRPGPIARLLQGGAAPARASGADRAAYARGRADRAAGQIHRRLSVAGASRRRAPGRYGPPAAASQSGRRTAGRLHQGRR